MQILRASWGLVRDSWGYIYAMRTTSGDLAGSWKCSSPSSRICRRDPRRDPRGGSGVRPAAEGRVRPRHPRRRPGGVAALRRPGRRPVGAARGRRRLPRARPRRAAPGRSLDALQAAYRVGARLAWRRLSAAATAAGAPIEAQHALAEAIFAYIDELAAESVEGYAAAQSAIEGERQRRRQSLLALLLTDDADAGVLRRAGAEAGWQLPSRVAVIACAPAGAVARRVAARIGADPLHGLAGDVPVVVVSNPAGLDAGAVAAALGVRLGVGPAVALDQAPRSLDWATRALALPVRPSRRSSPPTGSPSWSSTAPRTSPRRSPRRRSRRWTRRPRRAGCAWPTRCAPGCATRAAAPPSPRTSASIRRPCAIASPGCASCSERPSTTRTGASSLSSRSGRPITTGQPLARVKGATRDWRSPLTYKTFSGRTHIWTPPSPPRPGY